MHAILHDVTDWDDAYENGRNIPGGTDYPAPWVAPAQAFRDAADARLDQSYGDRAREVYDLFQPQGAPRGLLVFVHGGYWMALDKSYWSHLAAGPLAAGFAVAMPSYDLCPEVSIAQITAQIGAAITAAAAQVEGPIVLSGHSAGGHLVTAMMCEDSPLPEGVRARLAHVVSAEAASPALKQPLPGIRLTAWVGGGERQEFIRQTELIANIWHGLGALTLAVVEPDRHHFNVIDGLMRAGSPLMRAALDPLPGD